MPKRVKFKSTEINFTIQVHVYNDIDARKVEIRNDMDARKGEIRIKGN